MQKIVAYYDQTELHYKLIWDLARSLSMHYGYWDKSTTNFSQALLNINKVLARRIGLSKKDSVLDAGCGVGGSAIYLAKEIGCQVTGITLSTDQVEKAQKYALGQGVSNLVNFQKRDFTRTNFPKNSFDVVWAIESICHTANKKAFAKEARRIIKSKGRLVIADFFKTPKKLLPREKSILNRWASGWALPSFSKVADLKAILKEAGFVNIKNTDETVHVRPSSKRLFYFFLPGIIVSKLLGALGLETKIRRANVWTAYLQYEAFKNKLVTYQIISAKKP